MNFNGPPPGYNQVIRETNITESSFINENKIAKKNKIRKLIEKYEIDPLFSEKLDLLNDFEIVLLIDDSGSMNTPLSDNSKYSTRWEELKSVVNIVISIATIYDEDGIDIYFLNRNNEKKIKCLEQVSNILDDPPQGLTPLTSSLTEIFNNFSYSLKPVLVVIATDGVPYNGINDLENFKKLLINKNHDRFFISFLACSDQEKDIGYLNELDFIVPNVDTLDDYNSEKKEVIKAQGKDFSYTFGDHVVRLLLGPICEELDKLDEANHRWCCNIL